jgi:hypothetical protein
VFIVTKVSPSDDETNLIFPDNLVQSGSNIDIEIALRLTRSMWKALEASDEALRGRLYGFLQEEIDSLTLQHEIDRNADDDTDIAVAHLLSDYLQPQT